MILYYIPKKLCTILILFSYITFLYISLFFFGYKMFIFSSLLQGPPASVSWLRVLLRGAKSIRRQRFGLKSLTAASRSWQLVVQSPSSRSGLKFTLTYRRVGRRTASCQLSCQILSLGGAEFVEDFLQPTE